MCRWIHQKKRGREERGLHHVVFVLHEHRGANEEMVRQSGPLKIIVTDQPKRVRSGRVNGRGGDAAPRALLTGPKSQVPTPNVEFKQV